MGQRKGQKEEVTEKGKVALDWGEVNANREGGMEKRDGRKVRGMEGR